MDLIEKPLVIVLLGPPGAGKGTHAGPLSQHLGIPHISTGELFREHIRTLSPLGVQAKAFIDQGHLVPDALVIDMLLQRVHLADCKMGYILDGFPRTVLQAQKLDERLQGYVRLLVLYFSLQDPLIIERITGRLACRGCARPYHNKFDPPQQECTCDVCGSALYQRDDDREEIVRKRLEVYRKQTAPLIEYYQAQSGVFHEIEGQASKDKVFLDVLEALSSADLLSSR